MYIFDNLHAYINFTLFCRSGFRIQSNYISLKGFTYSQQVRKLNLQNNKNKVLMSKLSLKSRNFLRNLLIRVYIGVESPIKS